MSPVIPPPSNNIGYTTFEAFIDQQDIGWDRAIQGRISVNWGKANAFYCKERFLHSDPTIDDKWTSKLINELWNFVIGQWTSRNQFLYGVTDNEQIDILSKEADRIITQLYSQADRVSLSDKFLFQLPCQNRKSHHTIPQKLLWIKTVKTSIRANNPGLDQDIGGGAQVRLAPRWAILDGRRPRTRYRVS